MDEVLVATDRGLYCPAGDFHIDPWRPVPRAVITHGHSDHARPGMGAYLCTPAAAPVIRHRLGAQITLDTLPFGDVRRVGGAEVSFHPAGHIPGSAQVRVAVGGRVAVVSGDYKVVPDGLSEAFEPVPCHLFVTECTFGLPVFRWPDPAALTDSINRWWAAAADEGRVAMIGAYSLGKAQRVLAALDPGIGPVLVHGAVAETTDILRAQGLPLPPARRVTAALTAEEMRRAIVIAPPQALSDPWSRRFGDAATAVASGWMAVRGIRRRRGADTGFVMSDHADWPGLNAAVRATGAERVWTTHGYAPAFARWLTEGGITAEVLGAARPDDPAEDG